MSKRMYSSLIIVLAFASVAAATFIAAQRAKQAAKPAAQKSSTAQSNANRRPPAAQRNANTATAPLRAADPNRAPQARVDETLYTDEEFFGTQASVMRPYNDALTRLTTLIAEYPKDARLRLHSARLSERLGNFEKAASEIVEYANLRGRSLDSLRRLAAFYHNRARYADEVRTLQELARALPASQRAPLYKQAAALVRSRSLREFKPEDFFAELVAADPSNVQPIKDYVEELRLAKKDRDALTTLLTNQPKFPAELPYFLKTRAEILENLGDRRAAEEVYSTAFDPTWPRIVAADYYHLLRRFGRYRTVRRALQERMGAGVTDLQTVARMFNVYAYEGNYAQAARELTELEARRSARNQGNAWSTSELETVATMFASIGHYDQASRYLYTLHLAGGLQAASPQREKALHRLFNVMMDAAGTPTRVAAGDLSFYKDVAEIDQSPGFLNGVLSLILSDENPAYEFATQERAAASFFNRAFAYRLFTSFKQEYAASPYLSDMYLGVVNLFAALGEHQLAIEAGREFQQKFPNSPTYAEITLRLADSYVALKQRGNERAALQALLDRMARTRTRGTPLVPASAKRWTYGISPQFDQLVDRIRYNIEAYSDTYDPTEGNDDSASEEDYDSDSDSPYGRTPSQPSATYSSVLERYVSSLAAENKKTETVTFFWNEIKKYPREEGLYERFLQWLGQTELVNEQLKAYNVAIRQFDSNTWYHRLGRWYVRQKRGRELAAYSRQLIGIFDEEEVSEYLLRFAGYGPAATGDQLNWDENLAFGLYSYAHTRFPRNTFFVRGMLTILEKRTNRAEWERLATQYYFADRSIRESYLAWLSQRQQLRDRYARAKGQGQPSTLEPQVANLEAQGNNAAALTTYKIFKADAAAWLSHHDEALDAYRQLVALYPGEAQYADRLSDLARSFGHLSDKLYDEAARANSAMADRYPAKHDYRIKAGEVYAELGDFKRAGDEWNKLISSEPGERETYLEVATVYWDYYQYDQALAVFKQLRDATGDQTLYAYRMGAVYEGKGDIDAAVAEYVKVLNEPGEGRDTVAERLAQLARRQGVADKIAQAYNRAHTAAPNDWQLVLGFATYQSEREQQAEALALIRSEVERSVNVEFLESVRDLFRAILRPEDEQRVIARLATVARDEREAMMYNLQLAAFMERHNQVDAAMSVIDRLVADHPTNVGIVEESAKFYWRAGLTDRSLDLYRRTLEKARGSNRRSLTLQLARRQSDAGRLADAEATLRSFYAEHRDDAEVFGELAATLGAENKLNDLAELYQAAFKDVRESGLTGDDARARIVALRSGMIDTLDALGKHQEAIDQHIEIINTYPEDADRLTTAITYAEQHNLVERLMAYYEKLSRESFKNYRWQLVLARLYERRGNLPGATEQYRRAVANEPQMADLRFSLASTLARQQLFDEAIKILRDGWSLAGRDPIWLTEVARLQLQQGKRDEAVATLRQALAARKEARPDEVMQMAKQLSDWGIYAEAVRVYETSFAELPKFLKEVYISTEHINLYVRALMRVETPVQAYQKLERLRSQYNAIAANSQDTDGYRARTIVSTLTDAMRTDFGRGVADYATANDTAALANTIKVAAAKLTTYGEKEEMQRYLGIAHGAGLADVEEQLYGQIKDAAFKARTRPEETVCYNELRALASFYNRRAAYLRAAEVLAKQYAADPIKDRFDYHNQIANQYRLAGDRAKEVEWLRAAYASASGALLEANSDWVARYLALIWEAGDRAELDRLAAKTSPYQLQLINFLMDKGEKATARKAITNAGQTAAWTASRSGEVGLFTRDPSAEYETFFKAALDLHPIGAMLGRKVDSTQSLLGDDWFVAARNYGYWLSLTPSRAAESRRFVPAELEGSASSAAAQLELAAFYLDHKDAAKATDHTNLAAELAPSAKEIKLMRGLIALQRGDRRGAVEAWNGLISGRVSVAEAEAYLKVMGDNGLFVDALPQLENFLVAYLNRRLRGGEEASERADAIKPLVREIARRGASEARAANPAATTLKNIVNSTPGDLEIGEMLIDERLIPDNQLASVYRTLHDRLADMAAAVFGTSDYEDGYWNGSRQVYPAQELDQFRRKLLDYLIRNRSFAEARVLALTIEQEEADRWQALDESDREYAARYYEWLPLAMALIELRGGDAAKGVAELRRYCGLDQDTSGAFHDKCLKAYALLVNEGKETEADALLYDAYRAITRSRYSDDASLAGLAEIEARRSRGDEAGRLLKLMVERSTDNAKALQLAAETAARIARYSEAVDFRSRIAQANPDDAVNKLELARAMAAAGRKGEAIDRLAALVGERSTANRLRAQAAEVIGEVVRSERGLAGRAAAALSARAAAGEAGALLALAAIAEATGSADEARSHLTRITSGPLAAVAQMKLGTLAAGAGREAEAIGYFEQALHADADGELTGQLAFRAAAPRLQLIRLYQRTGRDLAAIRLAEGDGEGQVSLIPAASNDDGEDNRASSDAVAFEPTLDTGRGAGTGLKTLAELNEAAAVTAQSELSGLVAQSLARLGEYDRALAIERQRAAAAARAEERASIEKIVTDLLTAQRAKQLQTAALTRINRANATPSIYTAQVIGY